MLHWLLLSGRRWSSSLVRRVARLLGSLHLWLRGRRPISLIRGVGQPLRKRKIWPWGSVLKLWPTTGPRLGLRGSFWWMPGIISSFRRRTTMHLRWWKTMSVWMIWRGPKLTIKLVSSKVISSPTKLLWWTSEVWRRRSPVWKLLAGSPHRWWLSWGDTRPLLPRCFSPSPVLLPILANSSSSPRITNHHPWISRFIIHPPIDIGVLRRQFRLKSPLIFVGRPPFSVVGPLPGEGISLPRWWWSPWRKFSHIWPTKITTTFWSYPLLSVVGGVSEPRRWPGLL